MAASTAKTINGSDLMVFVGGKSVAFATNHKLTITAEMLDNASKDHASGLWKGTILKSLSWNMSSENLFGYDGEGETVIDLFDVLTLGQSVDVVFTINKKGTAVENTIGLSVASFFLGNVLGLVLTVLGMTKSKVLQYFVRFYVSFLRGVLTFGFIL